ncbi:Probable serine/threonine-protein kinase fnkA (FNIP repeat-containing protein A) [Durusdinium trenchii]|uniref:Probable serine/threonine-protein kinase fnkA (FNIP repeat-containing protein A) n=1 Tax=Durusdinium trenchii TaxID=1381693 RepID=A0ABP0LXZ1_9DINO
MGATHGRDVPLPDDAACEAMLRTFIALDLERAERLLRRADELVAEARRSAGRSQLWTISGLDGTSFQLPVDETTTVGDLSKTITTRIGVKAGRTLVLSHGGEILGDSSKPLPQEVCGREISYVVRQVCALEAAIALRSPFAEGTRDHRLATVTDAISRLTFGREYNQSLEGVTLPSSLLTLTFGIDFNQSLEGVTLPSSLQTLTFGYAFNQSLEGVTLPSSLQTLTFGYAFNQSLEGVTLPSSLQTLTFGYAFNQSVTLTFGPKFNQSLEGVTLPSSLQTLTFGREFNQSLAGVTLPGSLQRLTLGCAFAPMYLYGIILPSSLCEFCFWEFHVCVHFTDFA